MPELSGDALTQFQTQRSQSEQSLAGCGLVCARSGTLTWKNKRIAIHTDFGPPDQDKESNQDFALAWIPAEPDNSSSLQWAIALADGVTSSWFSEYAAEIACWTGLSALISKNANPIDRACRAVSSAGDAIGRIGDIIESDSEANRPTGEFESTWRFTLNEGLLLQTTLCLAWKEAQEISLAFIGDGGAVIQRRTGENHQVELVGIMDDGTNRVHALGPRNRRVERPDVFREFADADVIQLAIFTDGVGRGLSSPESVFDEINLLDHREINVAQRLIQNWIRHQGPDFQDNLSLAVVMETS